MAWVWASSVADQSSRPRWSGEQPERRCMLHLRGGGVGQGIEEGGVRRERRMRRERREGRGAADDACCTWEVRGEGQGTGEGKVRRGEVQP